MEQLTRRCQQGDREAMGQLYNAMHDELLAQCRKYAANDNIAEDLLHDAFLLIFSNIGKLRSPEKGRRWMHKVVRNVCLLYVQHRQSRTLVSIDEVREMTECTETVPPVTYDEILKVIDQLPRGYSQVFRLSVLEGLSHQQIAELLGIEPHTSSSQLLRAKRQLRQMLQVLVLFLLAVIPFGAYYFWSSQNSKNDVAKVSDVAQRDTKDIDKENPKSAEGMASSQPIGISDTTVLISPKEIAENIKAVKKQKQRPVCLDSAECEQVWTTAKTDKNEKQAEDNVASEGVVVAEKNQIEQDTEPVHQNETVSITENTPNIEIVQKTKKEENLLLSFAYSRLPDGTAQQLPNGTDGSNGDIDSVTHHRLPITVALNARYSFGSRWWLDGGLQYTQLSSETQVGNTYLYIEQQQRVRYLGLSLGVGYNLWHQQHWNLYATSSVNYELPLHSTVDISYWQGGQLIDTEWNRLAPHTQWSIGTGIGLQYNLTPSVGFFAEPNLLYYFHNSDGIKTWRSEHPFTPMLPFGIRISF